MPIVYSTLIICANFITFCPEHFAFFIRGEIEKITHKNLYLILVLIFLKLFYFLRSFPDI
jgi:hypothetical protein